jgi:3'(2'), 5'-bisphosphate nucleotidase
MHQLAQPLYQLCQRAGATLRKLYVQHLRQPLQIDIKDDASPVTCADRRANEILRQGLQQLDPGIAILSEESQLPTFEQRSQWRQYWLLDPLDGTREFIAGSGHFCISIARVEDNRAVLGLIYLPLTGEMYLGGVDQAAMVYTPRHQRLLAPSRAQYGSPVKLLASKRGGRHPGVLQFRQNLAERFDWVMLETRGSAWKFCRLAEGGGHAYPRFGATAEWDTAAGQAILEAAGGAVVGLDGQALRYNLRPGIQNPPFMALSPADFDWQELFP